MPDTREGREQFWGFGNRLAAALLALSACATTPPSPSPAAPGGQATPARPTPGDLRVLPATASYGDLVERIGRLDGLAQEMGRAACILARHPESGAFELRVELAAAVRPPPTPPVDLDTTLAERPGLRVLSRFGALGEGELVAVELTRTQPTHAVAALALTDQGAYLLGPATQMQVGPEALEALLPTLEALAQRPSPLRLELVAEAGMPLERVDETLFALDPLGVPVALATVLPAGTKLPESVGAVQPATCPEGLPESDAPPGDLDLAQVRGKLTPFTEAARVCAHQTGGRAMAGGQVVLAVRVGPDGTVQTSCTLQDQIGEPAFYDCLIRAAARLRFAEPGGSVDLHLPVRITPIRMPVPRAVCR